MLTDEELAAARLGKEYFITVSHLSKKIDLAERGSSPGSYRSLRPIEGELFDMIWRHWWEKGYREWTVEGVTLRVIRVAP